MGRGADIHTPNHNGGTCLINSVQNDELCQLLISKGVDVNFKDSAGACAMLFIDIFSILVVDIILFACCVFIRLLVV